TAVQPSRPDAPPPVPSRTKRFTNRRVIGTAAFCVLAAGILVGVLVGPKKQPDHSLVSPAQVQQERPEAKPSPKPAKLAAAKEKGPAKELPLTEKQKAAAADAIKALGRIDAAVEVGVTYQQYGQLVIDAKAVVNETAKVLPQGQMLTNISDCMDDYRDAGTVWNFKIQHPNLALMKELGHGKIIERYQLPVRTVETLGKKEEEADPDTAMQLIWVVGAAKS